MISEVDSTGLISVEYWQDLSVIGHQGFSYLIMGQHQFLQLLHGIADYFM